MCAQVSRDVAFLFQTSRLELNGPVDMDRPYDARMWSALGGCYEKLDNKAEALKAYKRSLLSSDEYDMAAYERVCRMCDAMNKKDLSVRYHYKAIEAAMAEKLDVDEYGHSLLAVAEYDLQHKRGAQAADWDLVERYLNIVMQGSNVNEVCCLASLPTLLSLVFSGGFDMLTLLTLWLSFYSTKRERRSCSKRWQRTSSSGAGIEIHFSSSNRVRRIQVQCKKKKGSRSISGASKHSARLPTTWPALLTI